MKPLTPRQLTVARMIADGHKYLSIAQQLGCTEHNIHVWYMPTIYAKTRTNCTALLVRWLIRNGLIEP